ncbi:hypothetical protein HPULCUR_010889 [Helicostylum pulchrum]|uniref:Uncharacterized protein n=1 Tax=Helicostylum pulchrum TaxID=562976 RepID=A0ABP9YFJ5_9FUNG
MSRVLLFTTCIAILFNSVFSLTANHISECPPIPHHSPPKSVHDLRADDIRVIAALGDSVTAGLVAKNVNTTYLTNDQFVEYRGLSWIMGGDKGAATLANYFKKFQPDLYGSSIGDKPARLCKETFFCLDSRHDPSVDFLNAAQSGATSNELPEQVDYLIEQIGLHTEFATSWKLVNLFIGFNDASISCLPGKSAEQYKANVKNSLIRLFEKVDYALVNIIGIMQYNDLIHITDKVPGYKKRFQGNTTDLLNFECYCCRHPDGGIKFIGERVKEYNRVLAEVAEELSGSVFNDLIAPLEGKVRKNVSVVFQPMNPIISTVPPHSLSNVDGYHPNTVGYTYLSKALWNQLYLSKDKKARIDVFNASRPVFCPTEHDRLKTYQRIM